MTGTVIDIEEMRRRRPALFREPHELAAMRIEAHNAEAQVAGRIAAEWSGRAAPSFAAYAPDPDADYKDGHRDGWTDCEAAQLVAMQPQHRTWSKPEAVIRGLILVAAPIVCFAMVLAYHWGRGQ